MHASTFIPDSNVGWPNVLSSLRWANVGPNYIAAWDPIANNQSKVLYVVGAISYAGRRRTLQWRHNERSGVSNHQPHDCLLNRLFKRRSKKTSTLRVTGLCTGNSPVTGEFPAQRPVTRKMFPFDDVIMKFTCSFLCSIAIEFQPSWTLSRFSVRGCQRAQN